MTAPIPTTPVQTPNITWANWEQDGTFVVNGMTYKVTITRDTGKSEDLTAQELKDLKAQVESLVKVIFDKYPPILQAAPSQPQTVWNRVQYHDGKLYYYKLDGKVHKIKIEDSTSTDPDIKNCTDLFKWLNQFGNKGAGINVQSVQNNNNNNNNNT